MEQGKFVSFTNLEDTTEKDFEILKETIQDYALNVPNKILDLMERQKTIIDHSPVNLYEHCLQTATRAYLDGADEEMIVIALLHDATMEISHVENHAEVAAAILKPYISENNYWLLKHHHSFQGYYYWDKLGKDSKVREKYMSHPMYRKTIDFCEKWDNPSFDPNFETKPLTFFEPMVKNIFSRKIQTH